VGARIAAGIHDFDRHLKLPSIGPNAGEKLTLSATWYRLAATAHLMIINPTEVPYAADRRRSARQINPTQERTDNICAAEDVAVHAKMLGSARPAVGYRRYKWWVRPMFQTISRLRVAASRTAFRLNFGFRHACQERYLMVC
jgi:hypothetical protein